MRGSSADRVLDAQGLNVGPGALDLGTELSGQFESLKNG